MEEEKNIDRLFQEKFQDFKPAAPAGSWDAIESKLDQAKKRPAVLPLWWKLAGVAAVLAVLISVFVWNPDDVTPVENMVVEEAPSSEETELHQGIANEEKQPANITDQQSNSIDSNPNQTKQSQESVVENSSEAAAAMPSSSKSKNGTSFKTKESTPQNKVTSQAQKDFIAQSEQTREPLDSRANGNDVDPQNAADSKSSSDPFQNSVNENVGDAMAMNQETKADEIQEKEETELESLEDIAAATAVTRQDEPMPRKKWSAATVVAPVYASSLSGSSISDRVSRENQNTQTDISYGVAISYAIDSRWSVRTGLHQVNMNYNNQDINYGLNGNTLILNNAEAMAIFDPSAVNAPAPAMFSSASSFDQELRNARILSNFKGEMSQQLGYLEMPFEVTYRLVDKKLGVNVLGGFSALFLTDNNVSIVNDSRRLDLGSDENFNSFNQSANFGIGLDYQFSKNIGLTLEPTFKYQLNSLKENTSDFRPYTVGVYTGLMYRF
ncbi:hypothetical protein AAU57_02360 [Nonlabens sp. YIK11]|uniref:outer membrane beta-barrel protein n=1 Tax=Nonlabens sp. YIK11 TaxID=1453349 RepID=UPI0006DBFC72|nr:outer membrane beta-barrel protein [Nonlabens sp. YIK11]KQC32296.1 hypothetical protein AAU57_02360 [Nonlabens sp. YIK11]